MARLGSIKYQISNKNLLTIVHQNLTQRAVPLYHKVQLENFEYYNFDPQKRQLSYAKWESFNNNSWLGKFDKPELFRVLS